MKKELKNILVPVDFKDSSIEAVKYAYEIAAKLGADVSLLHVLPTLGLIDDFFSSNDYIVQMVDKAKNKLSDIVEKVKIQNGETKFTSRVERGKPYEKILKVAEEVNARMIILGENHQGDDANQELGSTVYHVTLKSPIPVLTIKGNVNKMNDSIVVPLDLTKQMRRQLYSALAYAMNYGAKVHLVSSLIGGIKMRDSRILKKLKQAKNTLIENGIEAHIKLFSKSEEQPFRKVIDFANDIDAGMILVMTHKEGYTYDNYIGAFAHHIINESRVPVLSLTSAATNIDYSSYFNGLVDPAGLLFRK